MSAPSWPGPRARFSLEIGSGEAFDLPLKLLVVDDFGPSDPGRHWPPCDYHVTLENLAHVRRRMGAAPEKPEALQRVESLLARIGDLPVALFVVNLSNREHLSDFEDSPDVFASALFGLLHKGCYGGVGGQPFGAVLCAEQFGISDAPLISWILRVASMAHTLTFITPDDSLAASSQLREIRNGEVGRWLGLGRPEDVAPRIVEEFARTGFAGIACQVDPSLAIAARVAQCLKILARYNTSKHFLGDDRWRTREQLELGLRAWLTAHCGDDNRNGARPLRSARLDIVPEGISGQKTCFDHFRFELMVATHAYPPATLPGVVDADFVDTSALTNIVMAQLQALPATSWSCPGLVDRFFMQVLAVTSNSISIRTRSG